MELEKNDLLTLIEKFNCKMPDVNDLLLFCTKNKCSDLYIKVGKKPYISRYGMIYEVPCYELTAKLWNDWSKFAITSENNSKYVRQKMLDFSYVIPFEEDEFRYRVSAGYSLGKNTATFRMVAKELPSFENINFPTKVAEVLKQIAKKRNRITLFAGATGSGKTTTMAACINDFSKPGGPFNNSIIISLEDPIEYIYEPTTNVNILQKELGADFKEFSLGVKQALREHPNFINVGETRDKDTINTLIEASRTGHAVYTSFHAIDVADVISRLYNYLIVDNHDVMYDLISNMNLIICQKLVTNGVRFELKTQYLVFNDEVIKFLNTQIEQGKNIPSIIGELFKNEKLLKYNIIKDWD